jgi:site-specific DNA-methyltransferase (adenine-specific)
MQTKFFHLMISFRKISQDAWKKAYHFVPLQDFSQTWTDEKLYKKYGLTQEEIEYIESMIRPME